MIPQKSSPPKTNKQSRKNKSKKYRKRRRRKIRRRKQNQQKRILKMLRRCSNRSEWSISPKRCMRTLLKKKSGRQSCRSTKTSSITRDSWGAISVEQAPSTKKAAKTQRWPKSNIKCRNICVRWWRDRSWLLASRNSSPSGRSSKSNAKMIWSRSCQPRNTTTTRSNTKQSEIPTISTLYSHSLRPTQNTWIVSTQWESFSGCRATIEMRTP